MKVYDISRELFSAPVYHGDPPPMLRPVTTIVTESDCNVSQLSCCVHAGTHADAPLHYLREGRAIDQLAPEHFVGPCTVISVKRAAHRRPMPSSCCPAAGKRILLHGGAAAYLTQSAAFVLADAGVLLVGTDALSIAPPEDEAAPHRELLGRGIPVLERPFAR